MRDLIPIERSPLEPHIERDFWDALTRSAAAHGYKGPLYRLRFLFRRNYDHWLQVLSRVLPYSGIRVRLQRARGVKIGKRVHIGPMVTIDDVYPNFVRIEDGVSLAGSIFILTHNRPLEFHSSEFESFVAPVVIEKNAWVAIGAIILPGVTIGQAAVVAAGAVVGKDVEPFTIVGGVPARLIRKMTELETRARAET